MHIAKTGFPAFPAPAKNGKKAHPALIEGNIEFFATGEPLLAFRRSGEDEALVCLYNLSPAAIRLTLSGVGEPALSQAYERKKDRVTLGPNGFALLVEPGDRPLQVSFKGRGSRRS